MDTTYNSLKKNIQQFYKLLSKTHAENKYTNDELENLVNIFNKIMKEISTLAGETHKPYKIKPDLTTDKKKEIITALENSIRLIDKKLNEII